MVSRSQPSRREVTASPRPPHPVRQALRLTRTEFTQIRRYRMALFYVVATPILLAFAMLSMQEQYAAPGVDDGALSLVSFLPVAAATFGFLHVSNVYAVRREQFVLKRYRVSGVPAVSVVGATCLSAALVVLSLTLAIVSLGIVLAGQRPAAPVMLFVAVTAGATIMTLLGIAFTRLTHNAESTQMASTVPFLVVIGGSGALVPLDTFPEGAGRLLWLTPLAPVTDLFRSSYFGHDFFGGAMEGAAATSWLELWMQAGPTLLATTVWLVVSAYLVRLIRWSPQQDP